MEYPDVTVEQKYDGKVANAAEAVAESMRRMARGWVDNQQPVKSVSVQVMPMHSTRIEDDHMTHAQMCEAFSWPKTTKKEMVLLDDRVWARQGNGDWYRLDWDPKARRDMGRPDDGVS